MHQVIFRIPIKTALTPEGIPLYGFGLMLFVAFLVCTWLGSRLARREGIAPAFIQDLAIWIFIGGIAGARIVYMIQYHQPLQQFFMIWQGGLVFYGSAIGGVVGYALAYVFVIRKHGLSTWKMADLIAPCAAVGLCLGRVGCLLNGCCFGNVACPHCPALTFPLSAPPRTALLVPRGYQTAAGFTMADRRDARTVAAVEPGSPAAQSGLRRGDVITGVESRVGKEEASPGELTRSGVVHVDNHRRGSYFDLRDYVDKQWFRDAERPQPPPGQVGLRLTVECGGAVKQLNWFDLETAGGPRNLDFGFTVADCAVGKVAPDSPAHAAGLDDGDVIVRANDRPINFYGDLNEYLGLPESWQRGKNDLALTVVQPDGSAPVQLAAFAPRTLGLHPTQLYESISMALLFFLLTAYYPFRRHDGEVMVLFMLGYAVHRFLNEMLRNDTDPVAFGMTLSQNVSILIFVAGLLLFWYLRRQPAQYGPSPARVLEKQAQGV
jgi:prolipoprotein diacylglyceryltransferase